MSKSPFLDKNAYLAIYISQDNITANLSYSHYAINRYYLLSDTTFFDPIHDDVKDQRFWDEYFSALGDRFKWEFVNSTGTDIAMASVVPFTDEGKGISGLSFSLHNDLPNRVKIQSVVHSYIPTASIKVVNLNNLEKFVPTFGDKLGYDDILILNADLDKFDLYRFKNISSKSLKTRSKDSYFKADSKIYWDNKSPLIKSIRDKRFSAFSSIEVNDESVVNLWANYVLRPIKSSNNSQLHDLLRSFLTVQLVSMFNNNKSVVEGFGSQNSRNLLVVTGKIAELLDKKEILISILDGFQLNGSFDIFFDNDSRFFTYGESYSMGINSKEYIVPDHTVIDKIDKVYVVEVPYRGKRKAVFTGEVLSGEKNNQDLYLVAPGFIKIDIPEHDKTKSVLSGRFVKDAYVEGVENEIIISSSQESGLVESVFFDCREKPIVYGPNPRSNRTKIKSWLSDQN